MSHTKRIVVFAKTPNLSPIKTRLAESIGEKKALELYVLSLDAVLETVKMCIADKDTRFIAIAEEFGDKNKFWDKYRKDFSLIWTGGGGLGERLHNVYSSLSEEGIEVCMMGSDSPQIWVNDLNELINFKLVDAKSAIFGPSVDGGFYFFKSRSKIKECCWTDVTYSNSMTLFQVVNNLENENFKISYGIQELDIDDFETLELAVKSIDANINRTSSQQKIVTWIKTNFFEFL